MTNACRGKRLVLRFASSRGGALLAVLWLSAALSAVAFSVATTIRGEVERSSTATDGVKSYFLARGAIERALLWMVWSELYRNPDGSYRYWVPGARRLNFDFPAGQVEVQLIPELGKLNVNTIRPGELFALLLALGAPAERAREITAAILDWRTPSPQGLTEFDQYYLLRTPTFLARHASIEEIEEVLNVRGMTLELFHGSWDRDREGNLFAKAGLKDCLSVYASGEQVDVNSAQPETLLAMGLPPDAVATLVQARRLAPFQSVEQLRSFSAQLGPVSGRLTVGMGTILTVRATARLRLASGQLSDLKRTVAALVKLAPVTRDAPYHVIRWYDQPGLLRGDLQ
ncbi:MAG: type II secretion system protein GspK [Bryobacteraceae bacterium]|nr:type II secretion system protein GspK [Bryobacteraceae bacterium]MDW8378901.1 type II secretion system protein GspK [Bryobacterales bacterium]